ncbi:MAG TPA: AraC family transcriptional regulator [Pseudobacteroides sp.]|uniref:AraC family transcriptional regulator n=1 Tax=Pseudobacteroides sp. TaxID=1968840 RepID=UPI002F9249E5
MQRDAQPKIWESLRNSTGYIPAIVKTLERIHDRSWSMEPNMHEFFEMVYIKKGHAVFEISGQPVPIGPNDIVIIKPNQSHRFVVKSEEDCEFIVLSFKFINQSSSEFSEVPLEDFLNFVSSKESGAFISLKVSQRNEIITILNRILKERQNNDIGSDFLDHLLVMELFVYISRALKMEWESSIMGKSMKVKELIKISVNYINNNFERDITISDIAKYVFLSPSYFARAFKEEMGTSPINYLLKVRIERAKEILADESLKISDIAYEIGFSNQQRFNEIFKKYTKMTPLKYRKSISQKT